jgi:hypothetical protein
MASLTFVVVSSAATSTSLSDPGEHVTDGRCKPLAAASRRDAPVIERACDAQRPQVRARNLAPVIAELQASGAASLRAASTKAAQPLAAAFGGQRALDASIFTHCHHEQ